MSCGNLLHGVVMMQEEGAQLMSAVTKALLTITTEGWVGCAGSRSESSSSIPSDSPSTSVTVRSMVACFAFIVSILHLEFKAAICSWYPLIFWASSWGNIFIPLLLMQPAKATEPAAFQLPRRSEAVPSHGSQWHGSAAALLTRRMSPAQGPRSGGGRAGLRAHRAAQGRTDGRTEGCTDGGMHASRSHPARTWAHLCTLQRLSLFLPYFPPPPICFHLSEENEAPAAIVHAREMRSCSGHNCKNAPFSSHQKEWIVQTITHRVQQAQMW